jgi:hypothetical protein
MTDRAKIRVDIHQEAAVTLITEKVLYRMR